MKNPVLLVGTGVPLLRRTNMQTDWFIQHHLAVFMRYARYMRLYFGDRTSIQHRMRQNDVEVEKGCNHTPLCLFIATLSVVGIKKKNICKVIAVLFGAS